MTFVINEKVTTKIKKFDKSSLQIYDNAKYIIIDFLNKMGMKAIVNPNKYGVDLIVTNPDNTKFYCEVEVKNNWTGDKFPFNNIQVMAKKKKHFILDNPTILTMFNKEWSNFLILHGTDILECPLKEIPNKYNPSGEYFYIVPTNKAQFIKVNNH